MTLPRIRVAQAIKRAGNDNKLAKITGVSRQRIGELKNGTSKRKPRKYLPDSLEKRYREHYRMRPRD